jgi:hypothetical protein
MIINGDKKISKNIITFTFGCLGYQKVILISLLTCTFLKSYCLLAASSVDSEQDALLEKRLTNNVYTLQGRRGVYFPLPSSPSRSFRNQGTDPGTFRDQVRFVKKESEAGVFFIESVFLSGTYGRPHRLTICDEDEGEEVNFRVMGVEDVPGSWWKVSSSPHETDQNIVFIKAASPEGLCLGLRTLESKTPSLTGCFSLVESFEWRLRPKYPEEGYSDFSRIIADYCNLVAKQNQAERKEYKLFKTSSHEEYGLDFKVDNGSFSVPVNDDDLQEVEESFSFPSWGIESLNTFVQESEEEIGFECQMSNTLTFSSNLESASERSENAQQVRSDTLSDEESLQKALHNKLLRQSNFSFTRSQNLQAAYTVGAGEKRTSGKGETEESSMNADINFGIKLFGAKVGSSKKTSTSSHQGTEQSKNSSSSSTADEGFTTQNTTSDANEITEEKRTGKTKGKVSGVSDTRGCGSTDLERLSIERKMDLGKIEKSSKRVLKKSSITKQVITPKDNNIILSIKRTKIKVVNQPVEFPVLVSGRIELKLTKNVGSHGDIQPFFNEENDYLGSEESSTSTYYISPATILEALPAPGFSKLQDGSVKYIIKGQVAITQPLHTSFELKCIPVSRDLAASFNA